MLHQYKLGIIILLVLILPLFISDARVFGKQSSKSVKSLSEKVKKLEEDIKGIDKWLQIINGDHEGLSGNMNHIRKSIEEVSEEVKRLDNWIEELTAKNKSLVMVVKNLNRKVNKLTQDNTDIDIDKDAFIMENAEEIDGDHEGLSRNMNHIRKSIEEVSEEVKRLDNWIEELTVGYKALVIIVKNLNRKVNKLTQDNTDIDI
ncbi:MAG: hypothetical protein SWO11_08495 [Thermodesulfobacteriota bacterium]|nr:hypothetical protein [Thermodesulfobacteriota bacterium]